MLTGFELFACEVLPGSICELNASPLDTQQAGDDNCLCCCFHVIPTFASRDVTLRAHVYTAPIGEQRLPFRRVPPLELPPRA